MLRSALRVAEKNGYFHRVPSDAFKKLREHNQRDRICSPEEYEALVQAASPRLRLAIVLGYHTAMRLNEIATLYVRNL